jgi:putative membrane protein
MTYDAVDQKDLIVRDYLAAERTHLANERTLLAYLRSALLLLLTALTILKLFHDDTAMRMTAIMFFPLSAFAGIFGVFRYLATKKKLTVFSKK